MPNKKARDHDEITARWALAAMATTAAAAIIGYTAGETAATMTVAVLFGSTTDWPVLYGLHTAGTLALISTLALTDPRIAGAITGIVTMVWGPRCILFVQGAIEALTTPGA